MSPLRMTKTETSLARKQEFRLRPAAALGANTLPERRVRRHIHGEPLWLVAASTSRARPQSPPKDC